MSPFWSLLSDEELANQIEGSILKSSLKPPNHENGFEASFLTVIPLFLLDSSGS